MAETGYLNFDLEIEHSAQGFDVQVLTSPAGEARIDIAAAPLTQIDQSGTPQAVGAQLFDAVFRDEVLSCLRRSLDEAERQGKGLRIRLRLGDVPELANLPWESLYDRSRDSFLALSRETPLVRYLDLPEPSRDLEGKLRLRVLAVIASPAGYPPLDIEREWTNLKEALHELENRGLVTLERLDPPSVEALQRQLSRQDYHILHFLGHGSFDNQTQDSVLLLQNADGSAQVVTGQDFSTLLRDQRSLRLAVLNACEGAEAAAADAYSGVAQRLVRGGTPAVIAMRTSISDQASIALARSFYTALADGAAVDAALSEARKALFTGGFPAEWATPVLYMRAPDGNLWRKPERPRPADRRRLALIAGAALVLLLALGGAAYGLIGPTRMDPGSTMNIAVTEIGLMDGAGQMHESPDGGLVQGWMVAALETANRQADTSGRITIWHDGLPRTQKRVKLGMVSGKTPDERAQAAEALAQRIGADVVLYGHLEAQGNAMQFVEEFYVTTRLRPEANETIGRYQLGGPIALPSDLAGGDALARESVAGKISDRTGALYRLLLGLRADVLGRHADALAVFQQIETDLKSWSDQGAGKEILYYFIAREALYLKQYDLAESAAERAIQINPAYPRSYVVLGSIRQDQAQLLPAGERVKADGLLEQALTADEQAVDRSLAAGDTRMELVARLAVVSAHIALGTAYYQLDTAEGDAEASRWFDQVLTEDRPLLAPLEEVKQYRLLALAYSYVGDAYLQQGSLAQRQGDLSHSRTLFTQARDAFQGCVDQGSRLPEDQTLMEKIIGGICQPYQQIAVDALR